MKKSIYIVLAILIAAFLLAACGGGGGGGGSADPIVPTNPGTPPVVPDPGTPPVIPPPVVEPPPPVTPPVIPPPVVEPPPVIPPPVVEPPPPVTPPGKTLIVQGITWQAPIELPDGTILVAIARNQDIYLSRMSREGVVYWEEPVLATLDWDQFSRMAVLDGYAYILCVQGDPQLPGMGTGVVFLVKVDVATGDTVWQKKLASYGASEYVVADIAANTLYASYAAGGGINSLSLFDTDGKILSTVRDSPGDSTFGEFWSPIVVDSNHLYVAGVTMFRAAQNRITVFRFNKDLTGMVRSQYRNFSDSEFLDFPSSLIILPTGKLLVGGYLDMLSADPQDILLEVDVTTGSIVPLKKTPTIGNTLYNEMVAFGDWIYASGNGKISKIDPSTGEIILQISGPRHISIGTSGTLYATDGVSKIEMFDAATLVPLK